MSAIAESPPDDAGLQVTDLATVPDEPPTDLFYVHRPRLLASAAAAWRRRDVMFTLAERDIRATYKQAVLGVGWVVIMPLLSLVIFTILFHHNPAFQLKGKGGRPAAPYAVVTFTGMWAWGFFGGAIGAGAGSLLQNKALMAKTHFPRECFPISQILESAFTSIVAVIPGIALFAVYRVVPQPATLWLPVYLAVEVPFIVGVTLLASGVIVQARDLQQVMPMLIQMGMFATPVIWQFPTLHHIHVPGIPGSHDFQPLYSLLNPLGPVVAGLKNSVLLNQAPPWSLLGIALGSGLLFLWVGYAVFKRLEVNFADLS